MFRIAIVLVLGLCAATAAAMDTPLVLSSASGTRVVVIDPASGSISVYDANNSKADRVGLGKPAGNFVADLNNIAKVYYDERDGVPYSSLRLGSETNRPLYGEMFTAQWLSDKQTRKEERDGKAALLYRAGASEDAYWKQDPSYDGVVRAAYLQSGRYLALAIPSTHTLMLYSLDNDVASIVAWRNWGPELFLLNKNTAPDPNDMINSLRGDNLTAAREALGIEPANPNQQAAAPVLPLNEPPTPASDVWLAAGPSDSILLTDVANKRAILYQWTGKTLSLNALRDLSYDFVVLDHIDSKVFRSDPPADKLIDAAMRSRKSLLTSLGLPTDKDELIMMAGQSTAGVGKTSSFEATMNPTTGLATLNFVDRRTLMVFDSRGGQSLSLVAMRDYTVDNTVSMIDQMISDRMLAAEQLKQAIAMAASSAKRKVALLTLRRVLALNPTLYKDADSKMKNAFRNDADLQAQFQALIDEAAKKTAELAQQAAERRKQLDEQRKAQAPKPR